jgi:RimJ/RimL family protein N-acetyltransferase
MKTATRPTDHDFHELAYHFLSLNEGDRILRFGRVLSDFESIAYSDGLLDMAETVFVVYGPAPTIAGVLHLEFQGRQAYLGLSVSEWARRRGVGAALLAQACRTACEYGIQTFFARNLDANAALRRLAHRVGMNVAWAPDDGSTQLDLPNANQERADALRMTDRVALVDACLRTEFRSRAKLSWRALDLHDSMMKVL